MKNNQETGHAKNVVNLEKLVTICYSFGEQYKPSVEAIKLSVMQILLQNAKKCLDDINVAIPQNTNAIAARKQSFDLLDKLVTRINSSFMAVVDSEQSIDTSRAYVRKLHGQRSTPKKTEEEKQEAAKNGTVITEHSSTQMSFDSRIENFDKYIKFLESIPTYNPNEEELKIASLKIYLDDLKAKNLAVVTSEAALKAARISRNEILYKDKEGLFVIAKKVKSYVKSIYGAQSSQLKQLNNLVFSKVDWN